MDKAEFIQAAKIGGFTVAQAEFMWDTLALDGHGHDIEDIDGLEEALEGDEEEGEEE
jgi:hypothetical protein